MKHINPPFFHTILLSLLLTFASYKLKSQVFPAGFSQTKVGTVYYPTAIAAAPDGRIFLAEKEGKIKIYKNGAVLSTPFLTLNVEKTNERGISGIAIDPDFNTNHYVYVYYTVVSPVHNRLSRFTANGDVAASGSEVILIDFDPVVNSIHNGGGMAFGPDGKLYLGMGDDKVSSNAQSLSTTKGKLLRLNKDGTSPSGNPFSGSTSASRIWAYGFRNPYSISIQPGTGKIFVNDVGEATWEEINNATVAGKNFGWPAADGASTNTLYTNPVYAYHHTNGGATMAGCAISGGTFFNPSSTNYPSVYNGKYFFIDYCNDWINYIDPNTGAATNFASSIPSAGIGMCVGTDGNLYYMSISQSGLYRISYNGGNAPVITQQPVSQTVSQGQQAMFTVGASGAQPLSYQWMKNNVNIPGANSATYTIPNAQTTNQGVYKVVVSNAYGNVTSNNATLTVTGFNAAPVATISTPVNGSLYNGGDTIYFSGNANDAEDGLLAASAFTWIVDFHHNTHIHPGPNIPTGIKSGSFVIPQTGESSANVFYRIKLFVMDSDNGRDTVTRDVYPRTSKITLNSNPPGLQVAYEGQPAATPYTVMAVENMKFSIDAVTPQNFGGTTYTFNSWSQGGNATQTITIPVNDATYTALYNSTGAPIACSSSGTILREYWSNVVSSTLADIPFNSQPTGSNQLSSFQGPTNWADNYGQRIRGYICPPATGNYTFWIASDNSSELWISTNDQPANKIKRAFVNGYTMPGEWTKYPDQQSAAVYLVQGQRYYIEAIHREKAEGDHLAVGWALPGNILERPIPGTRLSPYSPSMEVNITSPANNSSFPAPASITISAAVTGATTTVQKVEFYSGTVKLGEDLSSPYNYAWNGVAAGNYTLTAKAVAGGTVTSSPVVITVGGASGCTATGNIIREVWTNISGASVGSIPVNTSPSFTTSLTLFKSPSNSGDNYGERIRGFICPPVTGNYIFWIASDDNSELWLSTNHDPANKQKIAYVIGYTQSGEYTKYPSQQSAAKYLVSGQKYYIEALHKEGTQGDNLAVGWQLPNTTLERPIPGTRLSPYGQPMNVTITSPANNSTFTAGSNIVINASVSGNTVSVQKVEFYSGTTKLGEDFTTPYSYSWNSVPAGSHELTALAIDNTSNTGTSPKININVINTQTVNCVSTGTIRREVWNNITGVSVADIPLSTAPASVTQLTAFEAPQNIADNYGQRIRGYICAPATGSYTFWISSDDNSELWLSTGTNPANKVKIADVTGWNFPAEWSKYPSQQSVPVNLVAGQKYYIEALHKEGTQGDNLAVGWQIPGNILERPIPVNRLSPFEEAASTELIAAGSSWKYLDNGTDQGVNWRSPSFNDSGWKTGNAELGYGDGGEATVVSYGSSSTNKFITTYFRKKFNVSSASGITTLELSLLRDDGAVVYLNGTEVFRSNMPSGNIYYNTLAPTYIDGAAESQFVVATISSAALVEGENTIAVEIHQQSITSSDISFNLKLKTNTSATTYNQNMFAVIGDYGFSGPDESAVSNLVKSWKPEYIITTGDNNYPDGAASTIDANIGQYYQNYIKPYNGSYGLGSDINRFFPTLGNHDYVTTGATPYLNYFTLPGNERYYDFVKGNVHFFAINSNTNEADGYSSSSAQAAWLQNALASSSAKWKIVYFHHSPYCSDQVHGSIPYMQWPFKQWGADIVLSGHSHVYERIMKDIPYIVNGLGGHSKYSIVSTPVSGSQVRYNSAFGALQVTVRTDTLWFRFYNVSNQLIDTYPLVKSGSPPPPACSASIQPGSSTTFCQGGNVTLYSNTGTGYSYQWIKNGVNISGATSSSYNTSTEGDYQVRISYTGCTAWSAPTNVTVNDYLTARITPGGPTTFCNGGSVTLYGNTCDGYIYQWKRNDQDIPGANSNTYVATVSGSYQLKIISGSSINWSALVEVTVNQCGAKMANIPDSLNSTQQQATVNEDPNTPKTADQVNESFKLKVFPNPTTGTFSFDYCIEELKREIVEIKVISASSGQMVYNKPAELVSGCVRANIGLSGDLPVGVYVLQLRIGEKVESTKLILYR
jgi:glucose/arabinose dehydrogenase